MPYKDKHKDRLWHKNHMRTKRRFLKAKSGVVTPSTLTLLHPANAPVKTQVDADGNPIYEY